jgi:hypothetical protein
MMNAINQLKTFEIMQTKSGEVSFFILESPDWHLGICWTGLLPSSQLHRPDPSQGPSHQCKFAQSTAQDRSQASQIDTFSHGQ